MRSINLGLSLLFTMLLVTSAQTATYETFSIGNLEGKLVVQWIEPDKFIFIPDREKPLTFTRSNGEKITPGKMLTDGGSIPRPLWILRNYSPWGYAPAFIIHDWLFEMKRCQIGEFAKYNHHIAADVMAEIIKTMMEQKKVEVDKLTLISMHFAVDSSIAEKEWNSGKCNPPPSGLRSKPPIFEYELNFE